MDFLRWSDAKAITGLYKKTKNVTAMERCAGEVERAPVGASGHKGGTAPNGDDRPLSPRLAGLKRRPAARFHANRSTRRRNMKPKVVGCEPGSFGGFDTRSRGVHPKGGHGPPQSQDQPLADPEAPPAGIGECAPPDAPPIHFSAYTATLLVSTKKRLARFALASIRPPFPAIDACPAMSPRFDMPLDRLPRCLFSRRDATTDPIPLHRILAVLRTCG
jgi:hypothetical protein